MSSEIYLSLPIAAALVLLWSCLALRGLRKGRRAVAPGQTEPIAGQILLQLHAVATTIHTEQRP